MADINVITKGVLIQRATSGPYVFYRDCW